MFSDYMFPIGYALPTSSIMSAMKYVQSPVIMIYNLQTINNSLLRFLAMQQIDRSQCSNMFKYGLNDNKDGQGRINNTMRIRIDLEKIEMNQI